jgi:hypothetical protein
MAVEGDNSAVRVRAEGAHVLRRLSSTPICHSQHPQNPVSSVLSCFTAAVYA